MITISIIYVFLSLIGFSSHTEMQAQENSLTNEGLSNFWSNIIRLTLIWLWDCYYFLIMLSWPSVGGLSIKSRSRLSSALCGQTKWRPIPCIYKTSFGADHSGSASPVLLRMRLSRSDLWQSSTGGWCWLVRWVGPRWQDTPGDSHQLAVSWDSRSVL